MLSIANVCETDSAHTLEATLFNEIKDFFLFQYTTCVIQSPFKEVYTHLEKVGVSAGHSCSSVWQYGIYNKDPSHRLPCSPGGTWQKHMTLELWKSGHTRFKAIIPD